ncbi:UxaA family hydrolase [Aquibacillus sp. 3ASR75-11]|uniref:UxaA family hydrolase n=1 Tax=Terrihalobacillus insolitus TaxID=2950438 RepID=A0A9X4AME4_9BACI|nr:UxaA family hydrolase [Terrihalobacillus insolitus]MDC3423415.1 UxaA family hydrolase [Terrihalobacillus insolitus]
MNYSFKGYKRDDGMAGTRNYVGIVSSVICSSAVVREISDKVSGTIPIVHANGCAQLGDDFKLTRDMLIGMSSNPNIHSALLVGLGCETNQVSGLLKRIPKTKPIKGIGIQQLYGGTNTIQKGISIAETWTKEATEQKRIPLPLSRLMVGILNVDADQDSLIKTGPVIGEVVDRLVENDAKVVMGLSKTLEPAGHLLSERIVDTTEREKIINSSKGLQRLRWKDPATVAKDTEFTEEELKLAALESKMTGSVPIKGILDYGEIPKEIGFHMMNISSNVVESLSKMASSGCNVVLIVSNRGVLTGSIALPCLTVAPQRDENSFDELIDYTIKGRNVDEESDRMIEELLEVCSGKQTQLEVLELGEFSIPHLGTTY